MAHKILIVEDTADISEALRLLLERRGYTVAAADNGFGALQLVRDERPDLVLMDLAMPGATGDEAVREIRSDPDFAKLPILCVSSYIHGREDELLEAGFDEVLTKTAFIDSYVQILLKYLEPMAQT